MVAEGCLKRGAGCKAEMVQSTHLPPHWPAWHRASGKSSQRPEGGVRGVSCSPKGADAQWAWLIVQAWNLQSQSPVHPLNLSISISEMGIKM